MLTVKKYGVSWSLSPLFPAMLVMLLGFDSMSYIGLCVAAAFWHECGHLLCMLLFDKMPQSITIGIFGMRMEQDRRQLLSYGENIAVSLAGPLFNGIALVAACACRLESLVVVHAVLMGFNLLPLSMLDGGQVLYSIMALHTSSENAEKKLRNISFVCLVILYFGGFAVLFLSGYNVSLLITAVYLTAWMFFSRND